MKRKLLSLAAVALAVLLAACTSSGFDKKKQISVVSREQGSGTRGAFIELFGIEVKKDDGTKKDMTTKEAAIANNTETMMTTVSGDPYAIGYVSLGSLNNNVKAVDIDSVKVSVDNIKNGTYKISRPFNIAVKENLSEAAQEFIDYILSSEGQTVVAKSYIAVDENALPFNGGSAQGKIVVAGSSSVTPIIEKLKEAYALVNPNVNIEVQESDSTTGMNAAIDGTCDIGMASRDLKDSEKAELTEITIALDGIAVIVNNDNTVSNLTSDQVKEIFTSDSIKWDAIIK